jgi:hypothetical protein
MRSTGRTPLDHAIAALAAVPAALLLVHAPEAFAQRVRASDARECAALTADALRLACYDRAFRDEAASPDANEEAAATEPAPRPILQPPPRAPRAAAAEPPPAPAAARQAAATEAGEPSRGDDANSTVPIVVVATRTLQGKTIFTTDRGEIWVQTDSGRVFAPEPPFTAKIKPGAMSSFFLAPDRGRSVRVRRAE